MLDRFQESFAKLAEKMEGWVDALIVYLPNAIIALIVLILAIIIARYLKRFVRKGLSRTSQNDTVVLVMSNLAVAIFMLLAIFVILSILKLDDAMTALLGTAGIAGLAIGLALQDPLNNMFSGIIMSMRGYFEIGDTVKTNDYFGIVERVNLRTTVLSTPQGQRVLIPNKDVIQNPLVNYTVTRQRRVDLECSISYGDDLAKVKRVTLETIQEDVDFDKERPVEFFFTEFGDYSIDFVVRFWLTTGKQGAYLAAQSSAISALKNAFNENDITIPFPIRTHDFGIVGGERLDEMYPVDTLQKAFRDQGQTS